MPPAPAVLAGVLGAASAHGKATVCSRGRTLREGGSAAVCGGGGHVRRKGRVASRPAPPRRQGRLSHASLLWRPPADVDR